MRDERLNILGNIPFTSSVISSLYPELNAPNNKVAQLERQGDIIRLKRGLFVTAPEISGKNLVNGLMANHIYSPSYISMYTALRHYGLIPEAVNVIQSMTIKHTRNFKNKLGLFTYTNISKAAFPVGLTLCNDGKVSYLIAKPEKALCDIIANTPELNLRYTSDALNFLEYDIRFDMDAFYDMDINIFKEYAEVGKKNQSIQTIIKLLENERNI